MNLRRSLPALILGLFWALGNTAHPIFGTAAGTAYAQPPEADQGANQAEEGLYLPTDRQRQRQFERARRLVQERRWSDAASLLDEILAADNDSFHHRSESGRRPRGPGERATWTSIKSSAAEIVASLAEDGYAAYELQFRARADKALEAAVREGDSAGVVAVARRWFHTPAGAKAAFLLAEQAMEADQPVAAGAWLDRLLTSRHADDFEPTLSIMRAIAWQRSGDEERAIATVERVRTGRRARLRIGGRDESVAFPSGTASAWLAALAGAPGPVTTTSGVDWLVAGGNPSRTATRDGFRPLLSPRYRVPLVRHPEEARQLDRRRRTLSEQDIPVLPASQPLAVGGRLLVRSTMGLLAVDFETGKRVWLQPGPYSAPDMIGPDESAHPFGGGQALESTFNDATAGTLSSDGRLVFAVESPASRSNAPEIAPIFRNPNAAPDAPPTSGNTLSAYDIHDGGRLVWRRPSAGPKARPGAADEQGGRGQDNAWFAGAPLPVGGELFVIVEERGGVRLDVLDAGSGSMLWSQPLAELDEARSIDKPAGRSRRFAGLSPSLAEGVLVCPTGAGAVVAVDLAARALKWAYCYPSSESGEESVAVPGGMVIRRANGNVVIQSGGPALPPKRQWLDGPPMIAGGKVLVAPRDSDELHCLDCATGEASWTARRGDRLHVAGVCDGSVIVVGRHSVEALSLTQGGKPAWQEPLSLGVASPSGRGCVSKGRLFLPLDTPEVVEIDLAGAAIVGRSIARNQGQAGGGFVPAPSSSDRAESARAGASPALESAAVPGNLVFYKDEVVSVGIGSLEVFHQQEPLEKAVETVLSRKPDDAWAMFWKGQLLLDRGRIAEGVASVEAAHAAEPKRIPASMVAETMRFAMERDFAHASGLWRQAVTLAEQPAVRAAILRTAVDGFLREQDTAQAWEAFSMLADVAADGSGIVSSVLVNDPSDPSLSCTQGRWARGRLRDLMRDSPENRRADIVASVRRWMDDAAAAGDREDRLARFLECFDVDPEVSMRARERLATALEGDSRDGDRRARRLRREFLLLNMAKSGMDRERQLATDLAGVAGRTDGPPSPPDFAWPVGRVVHHRGSSRRDPAGGQNQQGIAMIHHRTPPAIAVPCRQDGGPTLPGLQIDGMQLAFDRQAGSSLIATDAIGRRLGDPLSFDDGQPRFQIGFNAPMFEASNIGRIVVAQLAGTVAAFEVAGDGSSGNRRLWTVSGPPGLPVNVAPAAEDRRNAVFMLGMEITEPAAKTPPNTGLRPGRATAAGVPILANQSLELRDPVSGAAIWIRHRIPAGADLLGDERFLTAVPRDGKGAIVLSMEDGRIVRRCDLPPRESRLCTSGRKIVAIERKPNAPEVRLVIVDPANGDATPIGRFPFDARAVRLDADARHGDAVAVLDPRGRLTLIDLASASTLFSRSLDEMPPTLEQFHVMPWQDRLLVVAGRKETPDEQKEIDRLGGVSPISQHWQAGSADPVLTGSVWAVDRETGESLWPVPATVLRHGLLVSQPRDLPVLVFARAVHKTQGDGRMRLDVLCLDKRTGCDVYRDERDRGTAEQHAMPGCELVGDPDGRQLLIDVGQERVSLKFDGGPVAPRPPFQASSSGSNRADFWQSLEKMMNRAIDAFPF